MSSDDIRYDRRSEVGPVASAALIGAIAAVEWIEFMMTFTQSKSWCVSHSGVAVLPGTGLFAEEAILIQSQSRA
jgi:hypothetical protein